MKALVEYIVKSLVEKPEEVVVKEMEGEKACMVEIQVAHDDIGRVIGRHGSVIKSIRLITNTAAIRKNKRVSVEVIG